LGGLIRPLLALVIAPLIIFAVGWGSGGLLGLGGYVLLVFAFILWNTGALWRAFAVRTRKWRGLLAPENLGMLSLYIIVWLVWGPMMLDLWGQDRTVYALAFAAGAGAAGALLAFKPSTRRLRNYLILVYNVLGTLALGAWAMADGGSSDGALLHAAAQGWGILQILLFTFGAYFAPIFFLPPLLVLEPSPLAEERAEVTTTEAGSGEGTITALTTVGEMEVAKGTGADLEAGESASEWSRRGIVRRSASYCFDAFLGGMVVIMLVFTVIGAANIASWQDLADPEDARYAARETFEFAAVGRAFTDRREPVGSWRSVVEEEIEHARGLGLDYIRYDLQKELLDEEEHLDNLDEAVSMIRAAGLDVVMSPFGSGRWEADHPSFKGLVREIRNETLLLVDRYEPAWVFPFFEPNGQVAVNLGGPAPVEDWIEVIDELGSDVRARSNATRVLIEVAIEPVQGLELVEALSVPDLAIDAIGIDLYPLSADDMGKLKQYRKRATNPELGFWISEFGVETSMSGQEGQARAVATLLSWASSPDELNADGVCVWALLDDTVLPSNLGLVSRDGTPKEAYDVMEDAITRIRGAEGG
jgi:hypothetical protein